jgi:hypothetical protein
MIKINDNGELLTIKEMAVKYDIKESVFRMRYKRFGNDLKKLIDNATIKINDNGEMLTIAEVGAKYNIKPSLVRQRYKQGIRAIAEISKKKAKRVLSDRLKQKLLSSNINRKFRYCKTCKFAKKITINNDEFYKVCTFFKKYDDNPRGLGLMMLNKDMYTSVEFVIKDSFGCEKYKKYG